MKTRNILITFIYIFIFHYQSESQILINELQINNKEIIADDDIEYPSWVELYNAGNAPVNLKDYSLTDDSTIKTKWKFPSITIQSKGYLLLYLSGKNKVTKIDHWEVVADGNDVWRYNTSDSVWGNYDVLYPNYQTSTWPAGKGGIGYGDGDDSTIISPTSTYSLRKVFKMKSKDTAYLKKCYIQLDNDNRAYIFFNGSFIGEFYANSKKHIRDGNKPECRAVDIDLTKYWLTNTDSMVLTVWFTRNAYGPPDLDTSHQTAIPFFSFGYSDTVTHTYKKVKNSWLSDHRNYIHSSFKLKTGETLSLYNSTGVLLDAKKTIYTDKPVSFARIPDGGIWCISGKPSPENTNDSSHCYLGFLSPPLFSINSGFLKKNSTIKLTSSQANCIIRYTKNGNDPDSTSPKYIGPLKIDNDIVIKATVYDTSNQYYESKPVCNTYITNDKTFKLPIVSIVGDSLDLFDSKKGVYATSGYVAPEKRKSHLEYMLPNGKLQFELDADLSIHGNGSRGAAKKSLRIETNAVYDSSFIHYKLFPFRDYTNITSFNLRSGSQDQGNTLMKDEVNNHAMLKTNVDVMEHQSCIVYLNGMPWGIYHIREKQDNEYLERISGVDKDSIDLIGIGGVHNGSIDTYYKLLQWYADSLNKPASYDSLNKYLDIKNYIDYISVETFIKNEDWPGNNTKLWRPNTKGGKFRYLLYDTDYGNFDIMTNKLGRLISANQFGLGTLYLNSKFKVAFVNRYADLMNTTLSASGYHASVNYVKNNLIFDIPKDIARWGSLGTVSAWEYNVSTLDTFVKNRLITAREEVKNNFNLVKEVSLTLNIFPKGAGYIKLNTIIPNSYPWKGIYFDGVPVTVIAVPNAGFTFDSVVINGIRSNNKTTIKNLDSLLNTMNFYFSGSPSSKNIIISEINYNNHDKLNSGNWIELHNYSNYTLDLTGYKLKTSKSYAVYEFKDNYILPPQAYVVVCEDTSVFKIIYPSVKNRLGNIGFSLDNHSDSIVLVDQTGKNKIAFVYADTLPWPECADGTGRTLELANDTAPLKNGASWFNGCIGGSPGKEYSSCVEGIIISEINYNAKSSHDAGEWIELYNTTNSPIYISLWHFKDGDDTHDYTIPFGTTLGAHQRLVLCNDLIKFASIYPNVTNVVGPFTFGLSNNGEHLRLFNNKLNPVYSMVYHNENAGWPAKPNGEGYTLEYTGKSNDKSSMQNWVAGCLYGSPGTERKICEEEMDLIPTEINYKSLPQTNSGDWIELKNKSKDTLRIGGWKLNTRNQNYTLPAIHLLPNEEFIIAEDTAKLFTQIFDVDRKRVFQAGLQLNDSTETISIFDSTETLRFEMQYHAYSNFDTLARGNGYTSQLNKISKSLANYSLPTSWNRGCFLGNPLNTNAACAENISISEINFNGDSLKNTKDWFELYNYGKHPINLNGYQLKAGNAAYILQGNEIFYPSARLLFSADASNYSTNNQPSRYMNMELGINDTIQLYNTQQAIISKAIYQASPFLYANGLGKTLENKTNASMAIDSTAWFEGCFGGSPGQAYINCNPIQIIVSEINYHPKSNFNTGNWFELYNRDSTQAYDLTGTQISFGNYANRISFDSATSIAPLGKKVFSTDTSALKFHFPYLTNYTPIYGLKINTGLVRIWNSNNDPLFVMKYNSLYGGDGNGKTISIKQFSPNLDAYSNDQQWEEGCIGGSPAYSKGWCDTPMWVSEINYQSLPSKDAGDWFELHNISTDFISLNNYTIFGNNGSHYTIQNAKILRDSLIVLSADTQKFRAKHTTAQVIATTNIDLAKKGSIRIFASDHSLKYITYWENTAPWNDSADGLGYTLEYAKGNNPFDDPQSWMVGCIEGSPGKLMSDPCLQNIGITELKEDSRISLIPNPNDGEFALHFTQAKESANLYIFDMKGSLVYQGINASSKIYTVNLKSLPAGIYMLRVFQGTQTQTIKFVKQ